MSKKFSFQSVALAIILTTGSGVWAVTPGEWLKFELDSSLDTAGRFMDVAIESVTGAPFVSFYEEDGADLWLARYVNSGGNCGNGSWSCSRVDSAGDVGKYNSIALTRTPSGIGVAISYFDATNGSLKVAYGNCGDACSINAVTVDAGIPEVFVFKGSHTSATFDEYGHCHVAYRRTGLMGTAVLYAHSVPYGQTGNCGVGSASGSWQCGVAVEGAGYGMFTSIDTDANDVSWGGKRPSIAFYDDTLKRPWVATYVGSGGTCGPGNTWFCRSAHVGSSITSGRSVALYTEDSGRPHLAFRNDDEQSLVYARFVGSGGNCGLSSAPAFEWQCDVIDDAIGPLPSSGELDTTRTVDMARDADGRPIIVYRDGSDPYGPSMLSVARPIEAMPPNTVPNCGPEDLFLTWYCEAIDLGHQYLEEAATVAIDSNARGESAIAYHELFTYPYPYDSRLKVARQLGPRIFSDGFESGDLAAWSNY